MEHKVVKGVLGLWESMALGANQDLLALRAPEGHLGSMRLNQVEVVQGGGGGSRPTRTTGEAWIRESNPMSVQEQKGPGADWGNVSGFQGYSSGR